MGTRTTVTLDDDVMLAARSLARDRHTSLGDAISELMRRGLRRESAITQEDGFPIFRTPPDAPPITLEDTRKQEDEPW